MNYKRRSRRRDRRTMLPCGCCEDIRGGKAIPRINEDEVCMGPDKRYKRKDRPPKAPRQPRCPNGTHEWYHEVVSTADFIYVCPCDIERGDVYYYRRCGHTHDDFTKIHFEHFTEKKTCIHCWKVRVIKKWNSNPFDWTNRRVKEYTTNRWGSRVKRKIRTQDPVSGMTVRVRLK